MTFGLRFHGGVDLLSEFEEGLLRIPEALLSSLQILLL